MLNLQKQQMIRSKKITQSAKGKACKIRLPGICSYDNSKTMFCHIDRIYAGKGMGNKSHDIFGIDGCHECHKELHSGRLSREQIDEIYLRGLCETQLRLFEEGLINVK